ncbi:MAG: class I SAM-dependent methyltransferase, partial [Candidatus Margulisiibacteriota bacterium]
KHNNDIEDREYQNSVAPIVKAVSASFSTQCRGMDFGCGQNSVIKHLLQKEGFALDLYDPFFKDDKSILSNKYDFITCCEVIEHFHHPAKEFKLLSCLLKPGGKLYCMTDLYKDDTDFEKWYYKNDKTHVFFYHPETVRYIKENFGFEDYRIENRLIVFNKNHSILF